LIRVALGLLLMTLVGGCRTFDPLYCVYDSNCELKNLSGRCMFDGDTGAYCAWPAPDCPSGMRWDRTARARLAGECVDSRLLIYDAAVSG